MKTSILFLLTFFCINYSLQAQTVNGIQIRDFGAEYLQMTERPISLTGTRINLLINFGQPVKAIGNMEKLLLDSTGKKMEFNSIIEGLNFMNEYGYELIQPYGTETVFFLMRKKKNA